MAATEAHVSEREPATLVLAGPLVFAHVAKALQRAGELLHRGRHDTLDLAGVTAVDSAGLACVLAVMAAARRLGQPLRPVHIPAGLAALAKVCEVDALLA